MSIIGLSPYDETLLLTHFHVANPSSAPRGIKPSDAEVLFEAAESNQGVLISDQRTVAFNTFLFYSGGHKVA